MTIVLNHKKLLGFRILAKAMGAKTGTKAGVKIGSKPGAKV